MLKKDVWKLFKAHAGGTIHDEWRFVGAEADELCEAIAQAFEEEKMTTGICKVCGEPTKEDWIGGVVHFECDEGLDTPGPKTASEILREEVAALRAQVAVMAEAIEAVAEWDKPYTDGICAFCGNVRMEGHRSNCPREHALSAAPKVAWHGRDIGAIPLSFGQERVDIYICSRHPEQAQESEQEE